MTNALELVPSFRRQVSVYTQGVNTTDSALAGYIADGVQALLTQWDRGYDIDFISPQTYIITPDVASKDRRAIILMASIIYKMGNYGLFNFTDGDFSFSLPRGTDFNPIDNDRKELLLQVPVRLAHGTAGQLFGYKAIYNPENYDWWYALGAIGAIGYYP